MATNSVAETFMDTLMADARSAARKIVSDVDFASTANFTKRNAVGYVIDVSDPEFMEAIITSPAFAAVMAEEGFYWERSFDGDTIVINLESNMSDEDE